jgi:GTPase
VLKHTRQQIANLIKTPAVGKAPFAIRNEKDIETVVDKLHSLVPILSVSCVTGGGLDLLGKLFVSLPKRRRHMVRTVPTSSTNWFTSCDSSLVEFAEQDKQAL